MLSSVQHIAASLFLGHQNCMALFSAYFDESNTARAGVVAGCLFNVDQLGHFDEEWRELLKDFDISCLHMKHYVHSIEEFKSWRGQEDRRKDFMRRVIGILARRANISTGAVVDCREYEEYVCTPERKAFFKNIYTTASYMCLLLIGRWADKYGHAEPIAYVFDDGNPHRKEFDQAYHQSRDIDELKQRYRLRSLTFADDRDVAPLQAADFIAYELSKFWTDHRNEPQKAPRLSLMGAMNGICNEWRVVTPAMLASIAKEVGGA